MRRRHVWMIVASLIVSLASGPAAIAYANRVSYRSDLKWCAVVTTMTEAYRVEPPSTPTGKELEQNLGTLRQDLRCPPAQPAIPK